MADGTEDRQTPQESLFLFKGGYYSMGFAVGEVRSPSYVERFTPTDEERAARMGALTVNAGTYEIVGSSVLLHPRFALVPEFVGGLGEIDFEVSGDSLQLRWRRSVSVNEVESPWTVAGHVEELTLVRIR